MYYYYKYYYNKYIIIYYNNKLLLQLKLQLLLLNVLVPFFNVKNSKNSIKKYNI